MFAARAVLAGDVVTAQYPEVMDVLEFYDLIQKLGTPTDMVPVIIIVVSPAMVISCRVSEKDSA
ncbi:hypothetical protein ECTPHS_09879 [Ectothiorhodospira sp. PHS-1]|nr:hypothetical protein ECTPHS_09879 [Ectothiorhodospira sp. PHS-1]